MRLLHTSDLHVGKMARGRSRSKEYIAVLAEICGIAREKEVDATLIAGDIFDSQSPSVESEHIAYKAILELSTIAPVYIIAGNHDSQGSWQAIARLVEAADVHVVGNIGAIASDGVQRLVTKSGEEADIAMLPFLHHREAVNSFHLVNPSSNSKVFHIEYNLLYQRYLDVLSSKMDHSIVNILMSHVSTFGGKVGGGERDIHILDTYAVDPSQFPLHLDYVALGHLHATQTVAEGPFVRYCGAPMMLDFGETKYEPAVTIADVSVNEPIEITNVPITSGYRMATHKGSVAGILGMEPPEKTWLRVKLQSVSKAGELEAVRDHFGDCLIDIRVEKDKSAAQTLDMSSMRKPPVELFEEYMEIEGIDDERVRDVFVEELENELMEAGGN